MKSSYSLDEMFPHHVVLFPLRWPRRGARCPSSGKMPRDVSSTDTWPSYTEIVVYRDPTWYWHTDYHVPKKGGGMLFPLPINGFFPWPILILVYRFYCFNSVLVTPQCLDRNTVKFSTSLSKMQPGLKSHTLRLGKNPAPISFVGPSIFLV